MENAQGAEPDHTAVNETEENKLRYRKILTCAKENIENASRLLRRKIPCTGHLMTPRRLWIQTIPTQECDVVVMFPGGAQDVTLMWLLSRLRAGTPGLVVHVRHHASSDSYGFYLTAPFPVLLKAAEEVHLPKALRAEYGGGLKEFTQQEAEHFEGINEERSFFTTEERQWLVLHLLETLRASKGDQVGGLRFIEGQAIVPKCVSAGVISQVFPLHDLPALEKLQKTWVWAFFHKQPLDAICSYFGVKITMYFAWLGHYTTALLVPSIVGIFFWLCFCGGDQATEDAGYVLFSLFNVLWASIYVEAWKRFSAELAYRWGTLDQRDELLVEPRPLFSGTLELSPVTGRLEPTFPAWKRYAFRYLVSVPVILLCLVVVFIIMIFTLQLQEWWDRQIDSRGYFFCLSYLPKIFLAIIITLLDEAYYKVACWLNDKENYRLDTKYENHLIVKVALFQFVNSFLSLFYIAFYLQDQEKLKEQLAALLIARQVIGNLKESALPYLLEQLRIAKLSFDLFGALSPTEAKKSFVPPSQDDKKNEDQQTTNQTTTPGSNRNVSQAELESALYKYDGTFADHLEMFIQLGYVVLFSSAFPMAAFCALLNNLIEIRSDAFKLCFIFQRPFGQRVSSIGTWQNAMEVMGLIAVLVNCALIGLSGQVHRMFPEMSTTQTILLIVALEHIMLTLRFIITCAIPDLPEWLATEMAKVEFARREAWRRHSSTSPNSSGFQGTATGTPVTPATPLNSTQEEPPGLIIGRFVVSPTTDDDGKQKEQTKKRIEEGTVAINKPEEIQDPLPSPPGSPPPTQTSNTGPLSTSLPKLGASSKATKPSTREWLGAEGETLGYHLTIGPHGVDWVRGAVGRKGSQPEMGSGPSEELATRRSTDCLAASSDSDLLRSAPPWVPAQARSKFRFSPDKDKSKPEPTPVAATTSLSDSSRTVSSQEDEASNAQTKAEELAAKKTRVKQSLMKRARSVAIFSLKLKERRAREAQAKEAKEAQAAQAKEEKALAREAQARWGQGATNVGGELSCIPIEKLISVDDVRMDTQRRKTNL